jgi:hypothetical protein
VVIAAPARVVDLTAPAPMIPDDALILLAAAVVLGWVSISIMRGG